MNERSNERSIPLAVMGRNLSICHRCSRRQRLCAGACACRIDGADIIVHAGAGDCPLRLFEAAPARGLGDWAARWMKGLGAAWLARVFQRVTGRECGCRQRQEQLNRWFPFKRTYRG